MQGKPSVSDVLNDIKEWLPEKEQKDAEKRFNAVNNALKAIGEVELELGEKIDIPTAVSIATNKYIKKEQNLLVKRELLLLILSLNLEKSVMI